MAGRRRRIAFLMLMGGAAIACGEPDPNEPQLEHPLVGRFDWIVSRGGLADQEYTPGEVGFAVQLEFGENVVRAFRDNELVDAATFTVREDSLRAGPMPVFIVRYAPPLQALPFGQFEEQTIHLTAKAIYEFDDGCCDRYRHTFAKFGVR